ncbi:hypothetical protein F0562_022625 [Nyssa sinensis]|uniref:Uncharacterized protein n=1 Tax=Nyssa sinensis TaxID=561372 RepID=A0A5J5BPN8_9ASTE|nr:hypothetical protein F0562_022625 [Nyssa sinensis]
MAFFQSLHATINGLEAAKESSRSLHAKKPCSSFSDGVPQSLQCQEINYLSVEAALSHDLTAVSDFEDGEVYVNTLVVSVHDSPLRLTWADQASSGEFIPNDALDLEEECGGFSVNPNFLLCTDNLFHGDSNYGGSRLAQAQSDCFDKAYTSTPLVTFQAPTSSVAFQQHKQVNLSSTVDKSSQMQPGLPDRVGSLVPSVAV